MASADLAFTKDGLIYRPQHEEEDEDDDFLVGHSQKDGGILYSSCLSSSVGGEPPLH